MKSNIRNSNKAGSSKLFSKNSPRKKTLVLKKNSDAFQSKSIRTKTNSSKNEKPNFYDSFGKKKSSEFSKKDSPLNSFKRKIVKNNTSKNNTFTKKNVKKNFGKSFAHSNFDTKPQSKSYGKSNNVYDTLNTPVRINKFLADAGIASRRKVEELILLGVVKVNGKVCKDLSTKIKTTDFVTVNNDPVKQKVRNIYILLNKPKNIITTTNDEKERQTVMDLLPNYGRLFPVGRLDRNTTGVLLITNDGDLAFRLTHPSYNIERTYRVKLDKPLKSADAANIVKGVDLDGEMTSPCEIFIDPKDNCIVSLTLFEGKNHEVKRIFDVFGYTVKQLERKYFAGITASSMKHGEWRHLSFKEVAALKKLVKL